MLNVIKAFFARVAGSGKGILVAEELYRSILTSVGSGGMVGLVLTVLQAVLAHSATIFPNPLVGWLASMLLTLVIDLLRRLNHDGSSPAIAADAGVAPATSAAAEHRAAQFGLAVAGQHNVLQYAPGDFRPLSDPC